MYIAAMPKVMHERFSNLIQFLGYQVPRRKLSYLEDIKDCFYRSLVYFFSITRCTNVFPQIVCILKINDHSVCYVHYSLSNLSLYNILYKIYSKHLKALFPFRL